MIMKGKCKKKNKCKMNREKGIGAMHKERKPTKTNIMTEGQEKWQE